MAYRIKIRRTRQQNLTTVRQVERRRFKTRQAAVNYKAAWAPKAGTVVKAPAKRKKFGSLLWG